MDQGMYRGPTPTNQPVTEDTARRPGTILTLAGLSAPISCEDRLANIEAQLAEIDRRYWWGKYGAKHRTGYSSLDENEFSITFEALKDSRVENIDDLYRWTPTHPKGFMLIGTVGNGKSTLCKALINRWASPDYPCRFEEVPRMLSRFRATFDPSSEKSFDSEITAVKSAKLLVMDDLGAEQLKDWASDVIFQIIDERYRKRLHTFVTSNVTPAEIANRLGARIADRLFAMVDILPFRGKSFRGTKECKQW